jgi:phosphate transport system substrate-binding protein
MGVTARAAILIAACVLMLTSCGGASFDASHAIDVVSRDDGSGTRGAFIELFGIETKGAGTRRDNTTKEAIIARQTGIMMTNVSGDRYAIGYISLGSINSAVKAVAVDGVVASADTVKSGEYEVARPFIIATNGEPTGLTRDFIDYILSSDGQSVASKSYIAIYDDAPPYRGGTTTGKITVAGSSSVTPLMEKLREGYLALNPDADIEIQQSDSSSGITGAIDGSCEIAMSSRDLKPDELEYLTPIPIALDGIVVVVNNMNPITNLTKAQVKEIFTGETVYWNGVTG